MTTSMIMGSVPRPSGSSSPNTVLSTATTRQAVSSTPSVSSSAGGDRTEPHLILIISLSTVLPLFIVAILLFLRPRHFRHRTSVLLGSITRNPLIAPPPECERPTNRRSQALSSMTQASNVLSDALATYYPAGDTSVLGQPGSNAVAHRWWEATTPNPDGEEYHRSLPPPYPGGKM